MASVSKRDIPNIAAFMVDYWEFVKKYWIPEETESFWEAVINDVDRLARIYPDEFCKKLLVAFLDYLDSPERKGEHGMIKEFCLDCQHYGNLCSGETNPVYSGCIWKTASAESLEAFLRTERGRVAAATNGDSPQSPKFSF